MAENLVNFMTLANGSFVLSPQPIKATHWLNLSAGVSICNVFLGRSFNLRATISAKLS